ncbi:hypothetical protein CF65_01269 [Aggregatibacter actinomycetemcomitans HK1651]|nr:hypothetical protein CF65_01269 [Aggregatibacter actinomycetemcomitans HK1651]
MHTSAKKRSISASLLKILRYKWRGFQSTSTPPKSKTTVDMLGFGHVFLQWMMEK